MVEGENDVSVKAKERKNLKWTGLSLSRQLTRVTARIHEEGTHVNVY